MNRLLITAFCFLFGFGHSYAEEELDWELDFEIEQKSTIHDFPLKEIGHEELSNAAIEGALHTGGAYQQDQEGKPAYQQEAESNDKKEITQVEKENLDERDANQLLNSFNTLPPPAMDLQAPIYQIPNGRTYGHHETFTVERE